MTRRIIKKLSESTINRIAAGEVVERPASVIKELLENAIDAGATKIRITLETAGKNLIAIADNGYGMEKEDMLLAIERHTTSKLQEDDITNIEFFGFRGEALPSIASVSNMSISSIKDGAKEGYCLKLSGGLISEINKINIEKGTKIEIRDLFFATPARLKFLKSDKAEQAACLDVVRRASLAYPAISFSLIAEAREIFKVGAVNSYKERVEDVVGKDFIDNSAEILFQTETYKIRGYSSIPTYNRSTSSEQYLYVNNRAIKDKLLAIAIKIAYQDYLARDRNPVAVIYIEAIPQYIDVNVHPSKTEVRFRDSNEVKNLLISAIREGLYKVSHNTNTLLTEKFLSATAPQIFREEKDEIKSYSQNFTGISYNKNYVNREPSRHLGQISNLLLMEKPVMRTENISQDMISESLKFRLGAAICQIHNSYILSQTEDGIVITDQHAAHERLVYEDIKRDFLQNNLSSQRLLVPLIVNLQNEELADLLNAKTELLSRFGLILQKFGDRSIAIREVPSLLGEFDVEKLIIDLADNFKDLDENIALQELIEHVTETYACHHSIRAGKSMNVAEMNELLRKMEDTAFSGQCNHGRPTYVKLNLADIEKLFGRR